MNQKRETQSLGNRGLWAVTLLSLAGVIFSALLSHQFYQVRNGDAGFHSFCNLNQTMNCDVVAASRFAEIFGGLPLSSFATGWFLAMVFLGLMAFMTEWRKDGVKYLFWMACFGGVLSIAYFFVMAAVIKTYCLFCLFIDAINFALVGVLYFLRPTDKAPSSEPGHLKTLAGILCGSILVAVVLSKSLDASSIDATTANEIVESTLSSLPLAVNTGDEFPSFGPKDAPITIAEFSDFQCPYCRIGAFTLNSVLNRYPTQVRVVFRNFPLDPSCNALAPGHGHAAACEAARTVVCAQKQGKFQPVYEELFQRQATLAPGKPAAIGKELGLDATLLGACMTSTETAMAISRDIEEAKLLDIKSTPTFFINGHKIEGAYPAPIWNLLIERLLAERR